jgi:hypothetical protein
LVMVKIVTCLLGAGFNLVLGYQYGIVGVVAGGAAFSFIYLVWMAVLQLQSNRMKLQHEV